MSTRATPYFCPFCGEQDIREDDEEGVWHCELCNRRWTVKFLGLSGTEPTR